MDATIAPAPQPEPIAGNRRVLLIDDNELIHDTFRRILTPRRDRNALNRAEAALFGDTAAPQTLPQHAAPSADDYRIDSAMSGQDGLRAIQRAVADGAPYGMAFVDVRMPSGWDGVETVGRLWDVDPDLKIVLCTAHSDYTWQETAERLGNGGFVILKKPFDVVEVKQLAAMMTRAGEFERRDREHRQALEKLLDSTLAGAVDTLLELLEVTHPEEVGRGRRIAEVLRKVAEAGDRPELWKYELAGRLSGIGAAVVPGAPRAEQAAIAGRLIERIPRLEDVAAIVAGQFDDYDVGSADGAWKNPDAAPVGSWMLRATRDLLDRIDGGSLPILAAEDLGEAGRYDQRCIALLSDVDWDGGAPVLRELPAQDLRPGMILYKPVCTSAGAVVVPRGLEVTSLMKDRILSFARRNQIPLRLHVIVPIRMLERT